MGLEVSRASGRKGEVKKIDFSWWWQKNKRGLMKKARPR